MIVVSINNDIIKGFKENSYSALVHGCNCFCNMGKGLAPQIAKNFPSAFKADQATGFGDKTKLGNYSIGKTKHGDIINAYTQYNYGFGKKNCDYDAIESVFDKLNTDYKDSIICIPKIGAGLAGGDWKKIKKIINDVTPDLEIDVYYL